MSTTRRTGMTKDKIIAKLEKYRSTYNSLIHDQMRPLSNMEKKQFGKDYEFISILQNLINALRADHHGLTERDVKRYAFEALLLLTPSVDKNEIPFAKRLERYQHFLRKEQLITAGKYILDICFKLVSALLALTGVGVLFYVLLKNPVNKITESRAATSALNHASLLFKQHAKDIYLPTPGVMPKFV